ncbi:MAG: thiamine pyrophosphate-binding protein, partial [Chloroflexota bacterium]|nr:thiamine pyrophosphate-binding protein [Chloroflexota bacterium]
MTENLKAEYGSDVLVDLLKALDVEYVALNPGASFRELHDSIVNYGGNKKPEIILCPHEEIAIDIAHGYNKAAARPMLALVHNVIGLLHATMAIYNAWVDRAPLVVLGATGPLAIEEKRPWIDWIHTSADQGTAVRNFVKWDDLAISLPSAIDSLLRGFQLAQTEPKGPVYICLDVGLQKEKLRQPVALPDIKRYAPSSPVQGDPAALKAAASLLVEAKHPVVVADYLSRNPAAVGALVELAELLSLPVLDRGNMFSFPNTHPLDLTGAENELLGQADVVLALDVFDLCQA